MDVDLDRGANYGNTLTWAESDKLNLQEQPVDVQLDLNTAKFYDLFVTLLTSATPNGRITKIQ